MIAGDVEDAICEIEAVFAASAGLAYLGEDVTMTEHQLQAGALALAAGCAHELVVAALMHDVGHVLGRGEGELDASAALGAGNDANHDVSGARWLGRWFGPEVTEPVRLHVAAKRFLVATEIGYGARLSPASTYTLGLQGGAMNEAEVATFRADPHAAAAVSLRRIDEAAKDPLVRAAPLRTYRDLLRRVLTAHRSES